ncbi:MAG TPA: VTT domain-containing protein [Ramlibacter sp.]|nr:VTT domain-containing protein [Ramlibacter sp.]
MVASRQAHPDESGGQEPLVAKELGAMHDALQLFHHYGVLGIPVVVFVKRMGVPVPALPLLLLAGARGAQDAGFALAAALAACAAAALGDALWFAAGRRYGRRMLALVCKLSISPDICIGRSELDFLRRGAATVLLAKFIPGVSGLAPPLAGALGMRAGKFTILNLAGTVGWVACGIAGGWLLHSQVARIVAALYELGALAVPATGVAVAAYAGWLVLRRLMLKRAALTSPKLTPGQVVEMARRGAQFQFVDARAPELAAHQRLPGALSAYGEAFSHDVARRDHDVVLVVYCDCADDVSAARTAAMLRTRGFTAYALAGGIRAWLGEGLPVEGSPGARALLAGARRQPTLR